MTTNAHPRPATVPILPCSRTRRLTGKSHWLKPLAILCCLVNAVVADTFGLFTYTDNGTAITITDYPTTATGAVDIPSSIAGKPVTSIGGAAFLGCTSLTSIAIPPSVTDIGGNAFQSCASLTAITVGALNSAYSSLDGVLFDKNQSTIIQCPGGKAGIYTIPAGVTSIGQAAFVQCGRLTCVTIPISVNSIGASAFMSCDGLTSITIPASVISIGFGAFAYCSGLTSVTISDGVINIGDWAFQGCRGLTSVTIPHSVSSIGGYAFSGCGLTSVTIPASGTSYFRAAFAQDSEAQEMRSLRNVTISGDGTDIREGTFSGYFWLTSLTICDGVTSIGSQAFSGCRGLISLTISDSVTGIRDYAFRDCSGLTNLIIPNCVTSIGEGAFSSCTRLASITIPGSVGLIGVGAFFNCTGLTSTTVLPGVTEIGRGAFFGCSALTSVTIPSTVLSIGGYEKDPMFVKQFNGGAFAGCTSLASMAIPGSVASIGMMAFSGCTRLTSITIPDSVTSIESGAFSGCTDLTSVTIPDSVISIGSGAFAGCTGLTSITIPDSVISIGSGAFAGCTGLTSVTIPSSVRNIDGYWELADRFFNEGAFYGCTGLTSVTISEGVTGIGSGTFSGCIGLTSVTIPSTVLCIGEGLGVYSAANGAFYGCTGLTSVTISEGVGGIGDGAFAGCTRLASITIPGSVHEIGVFAFSGCTGLTSVVIPNSVTSIGRWAFTGCAGLTSVTIPSSVTNTGDDAFSYCSGLTSVTISGGIGGIGMMAFYGCTGLTSVTIPNSVTSIGSGAFAGCTTLMSAYFVGNAPFTGSGVFDSVANDFNVYYTNGMIGFSSPTWQGYSTVGIDSSLAPVATTGTTSEITAVSAILQGTVIPNGLISTARFEYGLTTSYGSMANVTLSPNNGFSVQIVSTIISELQSGQVYHYRLTASSSAGASAGEDMTFTTGYVLAVSALHGSVSGAGLYFSNATATLTATPSPGYLFTSWSGDATGTDNPLSVLLYSNKTIIANFTPDTSDGDGDGLTNYQEIVEYGTDPAKQDTDGDGINDRQEIEQGRDPLKIEVEFALTSLAHVFDGGPKAATVTSSVGELTVNFSYNGAGTSPVNAGSYQVVATIEDPIYTGTATGTLVISKAEATVTLGNLVVDYDGTPKAATATTAPAGLTVNFTYNGAFTVPTNAASYAVVGTISDANYQGSASGMFLISLEYRLTIPAPTNGTIAGMAAGGKYQTGTTATLTANPRHGYAFVEWSGDATGGDNPLSLLIDSDKMVMASFEPDINDDDSDGLSNYDEAITYGTHPARPDTDGDGLADGLEAGVGRFSIIAGAFTWAQARADAHARGGELACFPTQVRWNRVMELLGSDALDPYAGLWIGASDAAAEGTWTWVNGEAFVFKQWATARPGTAEGNTLDYAEVCGGDSSGEIGKWYDRGPTSIRDGYILEIGYSTDPAKADTDGDGLPDGQEVNLLQTNPILADTDRDGLSDGQEVDLFHTNPLLADTDGDELSDGQEVNLFNSNPLLIDTDGDTFFDGTEVEFGGNPVAAALTPEFRARSVLGTGSGTIQFRFLSQQGRTYSIYASTDLAGWTLIETGIAGTGGTLSRMYSSAAAPKRWFRAKRE